MSEEEARKTGRRGFLKNTGTVSFAAGAAAFGGLSLANAKAEDEKDAIGKYWQSKQEEYEAKEKKLRKAYKAFDKPPKHVYRGTDWSDERATFYAPL
ncbi:MAG: hypothetical protein SV775_14685 [Thermodesulfobacteriota bacterium]|nr:hypothetical protein [Thermodesulfobacteriota bacterium]